MGIPRLGEVWNAGVGSGDVEWTEAAAAAPIGAFQGSASTPPDRPEYTKN